MIPNVKLPRCFENADQSWWIWSSKYPHTLMHIVVSKRRMLLCLSKQRMFLCVSVGVYVSRIIRRVALKIMLAMREC